jgi:hypothetical protein
MGAKKLRAVKIECEGRYNFKKELQNYVINKYLKYYYVLIIFVIVLSCYSLKV